MSQNTKTYRITAQKAGQSPRIMPALFIYASSQEDAEMQFTEWLLDWLEEKNSESGAEAYGSLVAAYQCREFINRYWYDSTTYELFEEVSYESTVQ